MKSYFELYYAWLTYCYRRSDPSIKRRWSHYKRWLSRNFLPLLFDLLCSASIIVVLSKECLRTMQSGFGDYANALLCLLPALITVISVSLQIRDQTIYGLPMRRYQELRKYPCFEFVHMVVIVIALFVLELIARLMNHGIALACISIISLVYALWFALSELPLLMKNERVARYILSHHIQSYEDNDEGYDHSQTNNNLFYHSIDGIINEKGLKQAFLALKRINLDDSFLASYLLNIKLKYLTDLHKELLVRKDNPYFPALFVDPLIILQESFEDLKGLLSFDGVFNYTLIYDDMDIYPLIRLTNLLHLLARDLSLDESEEIQEYKHALLSYYWHLDKNNASKLLNNYISILVHQNALCGQTWFLKAFRDYDYLFSYYKIDKYPLVYFAAMILCHAFNSRYVRDDYKMVIQSFMEEKSNGLNTNGFSLRENLAGYIQNSGDSELLFEALGVFISISSQLNRAACDIYPEANRSFLVDDSSSFNTQLVVKYWIEILLFTPSICCDKKTIKLHFDRLCSDYRLIIKDTIEKRFLEENGTMKHDVETPFFIFLFGSSLRCFNKTVADCLLDLRNTQNLEDYDSNHQPLDDIFIHELELKGEELVASSLESLPVFEKYKDDEVETYSNEFKLEGERDDIYQLFRSCLRELPMSINRIICAKVLSKIHRIALLERYSQGDIERILSLKPLYKGDDWRLLYDCSEEQDIRLKELNMVSVDYLPNHTFAAQGGVLFKVPDNGISIAVRRATSQEINDIIDNDYVLSNGLYTFSNYKNPRYGSFLVTREELYKKLFDRVVFVKINATISTKIDPLKILSFKFEK